MGACRCVAVLIVARFARIVMGGVSCHITQRGNNEQDVFFVDDDRRVYLELLQRSAQYFGLTVHRRNVS